jgi:hypothetical protein
VKFVKLTAPMMIEFRIQASRGDADIRPGEKRGTLAGDGEEVAAG